MSIDVKLDDQGAIVAHHRYTAYGVDAAFGAGSIERVFEGQPAFGSLIPT